MKKLMVFTLCALVALSLTACGAGAEKIELVSAGEAGREEPIADASVEDEASVVSEPLAEEEAGEEMAGIANPFVDYETLDEAAKLAGFELSAPDKLDGYPDKLIQAIDGELLQVLYLNGDDEVLVRKVLGAQDVSGDYNEYPETDTVKIGKLDVTERGSDGKVNVAIWTNGDYTYAIDATPGISPNTVAELIKTIE